MEGYSNQTKPIVQVGQNYNYLFIVLLLLFFFFFFLGGGGGLRRFQHCTGHITTGGWKGRGNQCIQTKL